MSEKLEIPGLKSRALIERKNKCTARGISQGTPLFIENASGAVMTDVDGNQFIDFYGGIGVLNAGHCPLPVVNAIKEQAEKLIHTCFMASMYEGWVDLAEKLIQITPIKGDLKATYVNSGAEAVENAVKIARAHTKRTGVIAFEMAFHGRTNLAMGLTSKVKPYKYGFGPFAPEIYKIPSAYCYRCFYRSNYPSCGMHCLEQFERFFAAEVEPETIAAMIIEPVQGEGGFIVPPKEFLPGLKTIAEKYGIVFIADEVQTGFGRTGKMFAVENYGVEPDLITMAKSIAAGMPLSVVVGKAEIMDAPGPGMLGGTYAGNPLSCAAGLATINYIEEEKLPDRAAKIGDYVVNRLKVMQEKYPLIGDIRSLGAMIGIELVKDRETKEPAKEETAQITQECLSQGLIIISAGVFGNVIRMLMPLVITNEQLEIALNILDEAFDKVQNGKN
ncbi:4-aminobutyrate--2-oxoglutarate transaminase [Desulfosporosinus sp.]|uniref:4-aminobutyrate--2-oxoglutarate transaminase n=1 Tax=Desulfosporosinus sp. TaxID=157907 RepID=UPI0025C66BA8|nr:4-aminobutyrate--2-oxoglutarate transaminase [Desulfosporosinus sp.]MBC2724032.1 4-aminobutyrate--2-oxoglutarate transaminase [Desulfosporosinus sp.]MBC2725933.1 4-aminobutyrate--2-oxoglutarate transaminase [Desulfosporosinus sp.]